MSTNPATSSSRKAPVPIARKPSYRPLLPKPPIASPVDQMRGMASPGPVGSIAVKTSISSQRNNSIDRPASPLASSPLDIGASSYNAISIGSSPSSGNGTLFNGTNCPNIEATSPGVYNNPRRPSSVSNRRISATTGPNSRPTITKRAYSSNGVASTASTITPTVISSSGSNASLLNSTSKSKSTSASTSTSILAVGPSKGSPAVTSTIRSTPTSRYPTSSRSSSSENKFITIGQPANLRNLPSTIAPASSSSSSSSMSLGSKSASAANISNLIAMSISTNTTDLQMARTPSSANSQLDSPEYSFNNRGLAAGQFNRSSSSPSLRPVAIAKRTSGTSSSASSSLSLSSLSSMPSSTGHSSHLSTAILAAASTANSSSSPNTPLLLGSNLGPSSSSSYTDNMNPALAAALDFQSSLDSFDDMLNSIEPVSNFDLAKPIATGEDNFTWPDASDKSSNINHIPLWDPSEILSPQTQPQPELFKAEEGTSPSATTTPQPTGSPSTCASSSDLPNTQIDGSYAKDEIDEFLDNIKFESGFSTIDEASRGGLKTTNGKDNNGNDRTGTTTKSAANTTKFTDQSLLMDNNDFFSFLDTGINI